MWYLLFSLQLVLIYLTSRYVMQKLFFLLKDVTKSTSVSFYILSLIYLPGTILHELSHLLTSIVLFVLPHRMSFIPHISEVDSDTYHVRMGSVHHAKTDPIRAMLIGTAPLVYGIAFFYLVFEASLFPHTNVFMNILMVYLFFAVSSSMFSSREDLKESLIIIPVSLLIVSGLIAFDIDVFGYLSSFKAVSMMKTFNLYLSAATITNTAGAFILKNVGKK